MINPKPEQAASEPTPPGVFSYTEALDYINSLVNYEKVPMPPPTAGAFNLERIRRFLGRLNQPQSNYPAIVVAGTKGKGSTALLIASALQIAGYRVGLYSQPHLHTYRERIRVNGALIQREELAELVSEMRPIVQASLEQDLAEWGAITSYEVGTGLALLYFARQQVEMAVLEIGLGGRLDAVNVVEPIISVITSLSLDHMAVLGDTIEQIAAEKAGIIKPGIPVLTVPQWAEAMPVLEKISTAQNASLIIVEPARLVAKAEALSPQNRRHPRQSVSLEYGPQTIELDLPLLGAHQRLNAALAARAVWEQQLRPGGLAVRADQLAAGFEQADWPARLEILQDIAGQPLIVTDGAHNAESIARLRQALTENFYYQKLWLVVGIYSDKDLAGIFKELRADPVPAGLILTRSRNPRATDPLQLAEIAAHYFDPDTTRLETSQSVTEAIEKARQLAGPLDLIAITGSLSVAAESEELFF